MDLRVHLDNEYGRGIFGFSDISIEKVNNAKEKYANDVDFKEVVLLIDDTVFGSAKCGVLITFDGLYIGEDFEKPVYFSFDKMNSICMKRNVLGGLFINNKKVKGFTQPEYKDLKLVFEKLDAYIDYYNSDNRYIPIKDLPNTLDVSNSNGVNKVLEEKNAKKINSQTTRDVNSEIKEENKLHSNSEFSHGFNIIDSDKLFPIFMQLNTVNKISGAASLFLGGSNNSTNTSEKIRKLLSNYIIKNVMTVRRASFEAKGYKYFINDIATIETIILASCFLRFELERRGVNKNQYFNIIDLGLQEVFPSMSPDIEFVVKASLDPNDLKESISYFYTRLIVANVSKGAMYAEPEKLSEFTKHAVSMNQGNISYTEEIEIYIAPINFDKIFVLSREVVDEILDLIR